MVFVNLFFVSAPCSLFLVSFSLFLSVANFLQAVVSEKQKEFRSNELAYPPNEAEMREVLPEVALENYRKLSTRQRELVYYMETCWALSYGKVPTCRPVRKLFGGVGVRGERGRVTLHSGHVDS